MADVFQLNPETLHICFSRSENEYREAVGIITGIALRGELEFHNTQELLLLIDKALDMIGRPQASRASRTDFTGGEQEAAAYNADLEIYHTIEEIQAKKGERATFNILFRSRYYSTWQGAVFAEDGAFLGEFSSALRLLEIILKHLL